MGQPRQVVINNPVINSPSDEPRRHFRFSDERITNDIVTERRERACFIPSHEPRETCCAVAGCGITASAGPKLSRAACAWACSLLKCPSKIAKET